MHVGILGSGLMGGKLGTVFARAGHQVVFSYARSEQKLKLLARDAHARAGTPREAVQDADAGGIGHLANIVKKTTFNVIRKCYQHWAAARRLASPLVTGLSSKRRPRNCCVEIKR